MPRSRTQPEPPEFFVDRQTPYFDSYVKRYTDLPFLVRLDERDGAYVPGKFLTAADLPGAAASRSRPARTR